MAPKLVLLAVVLAVLVLNVHAQEDDQESASIEVKCRRLEEFKECSNSCKEAKCPPAGNMVCPEVCEPGCYCKKGSSRNSFGNCVPNYMCAYKNYIGG